MSNEANICPSCRVDLDLPRELHGRKGECPCCGCKFIMGSGEIVTPAPVRVSAPLPVEAVAVPKPSSRRCGVLLPLTLLLCGLGLLGGGIRWFSSGGWAGATQAEAVGEDAVATEAGPAFKTLGTISGIDVITWTDAPAALVPDADLQVLLDEGAGAFEWVLTAKLKEALGGELTETRLREQVTRPEELLPLARYELVQLAGTNSLDQVLGRRQGREFLTRLLSSQVWLDDFLVTGPFGKDGAGPALHALCSIYRYDKECTLPLYRKLACAYAHDFGGDWEDEAFHQRLLDRFQGQKRVHKLGRMHGSFDRMESWEMRYVAANSRVGDSRAIDYMQRHVNYPRGRYYGACWTIAYRRNNIFGDSIHGRDYYRPWVNGFAGRPLHHKVGGVCGTLSNYGSALARVHGIPSFPVGQPGHCAYMIRPGDEKWGTAYSVTGNTGAGSFFGGGDESIVRLMQTAYSNQNRAQLLRAYRHNWQARFLQQQNPELFSAGERLARERSLRALPLHLNHWKGYAERMAASPDTRLSGWEEFSRRFMRSFGAWQRPCWEFVTAQVLPHLKELSPADRIHLVLSWHEALPQEGPVHRIGSRLTGHLDKQAAGLKEAADRARLFRGLLCSYAGGPDLPTIISWGRTALGGKPESVPLFLKELENFSRDHSDQSKGFAHILGELVTAAEKTGDVETFASASRLAAELFPHQFNKIHHISEADLKAKAPKGTMKFPGKLLSAGAIPTLQNPYDSYSPLGHFGALQPDGVGMIITKKEKGAKVTLQLPGPCKLSGLVIMSRFEKKDYMQRLLPLAVSRSSDGKTWEPLGTLTEPKPLYEINLAAKAPEAAWLRFEHVDPERVEYIEMRAIRVYGSPLY